MLKLTITATIQRACGCNEDMLFGSHASLEANRKRLESTPCFRKSCRDGLGVRSIEDVVKEPKR